MVFHDLLDDREAEPSSLAAGRHIGLGQPLAPFLRQSPAIVFNDDPQAPAVLLQGQRYLARGQRLAGLLIPALDRLGGILQDVGQYLRDLAAVAVQRHGMSRQVRDVANVGIAVALQEQGLLAQLLRILRFHRGPRHAGKRGELVDHAANVTDLTDDRVGAHREGLGVFLDLLQIATLQPLGRKLDRRQRVLDLVRDAAGNVAPRRHALRRHQIGDIVEGDDEAGARRGADANQQNLP